MTTTTAREARKFGAYPYAALYGADVIGGIEVAVNRDGLVRELCPECEGTGYRPGYAYSDGSRCWPCRYSGLRSVAWTTEEAFTKRVARRAAAAARRAAKWAEQEAETARVHAEWDRMVADMVAAHPLLADLSYLENYSRMPFGWSRLDRNLLAALQYGNRPMDVTEEAIAKAEAAVQAVIDEATAATPVPAGRMVVSGEVLAVKVVEGYYGTTTKMLVRDYRGFRVWGSVPSAIWDVEKGQAVSFTATLEAGNEVGFGFFARPTKAAITA